MAELKPAYLIHGDDHGAVAERRAGLRALAERQPGGAASVELLEGEASTPASVALALATMTLPMMGAEAQATQGSGAGSLGRVIIVDGVERWRQADVEKHLLPAMRQMPPDTTLALFAREEQRAAAPEAVHEAIRLLGGQVVAQMAVKPWELAKWVRAGESVAEIKRGLRMPARAAARLVADVERNDPQRLRAALEALADLELDARGGAPFPAARTLAHRRSLAALDEDTAALRTIEAITR